MANQKPTADINILIVDDDQLVRNFAVNTIEYGLNRKVTTMDSGFSAWEYIQNQPEKVDVIIADANIPDINGLELLGKVKTAYPNKKFIITTSDTAHENDAHQQGADVFLTKPYDVSDLFSIVQKFVIDAAPPSGTKVTEFPGN